VSLKKAEDWMDYAERWRERERERERGKAVCEKALR
jgi:hypothetical protein